MGITRRDFLSRSILGAGAGLLSLFPVHKVKAQTFNWPSDQKLGRVCKGKVYIRAKPYLDAQVLKEIYDDEIVVWVRDVVGANPGGASSIWAETPEGYIYAPRLQPVFSKPNPVVSTLPDTSLGRGFWGEVTVPYVDLQIYNPPIRTKGFDTPRLYYGQVVWIDDIDVSNPEQVLYRVNEKYGYGDLFWAKAEAFHILTENDISPIHPDVENKKVVVNLNQQILACYEGNREVFFARISSGGKYDKEGNPSTTWSTPVGPHPIYRKLVSLFMSGPITGNWSGVAWTALITGEGVAVHSTYWHNEFGVARSHGCINLLPEDAKWVFRWTYPHVSLYPGELDVHEKWPPVGTVVEVIG